MKANKYLVLSLAAAGVAIAGAAIFLHQLKKEKRQ
jgi:hypothetical protein